MKSERLSTPKLVFGVGINDVGYVVKRYEYFGYVDGKQKRKLIWSCPYHQVWSDMLKRCYSTKSQIENPTYKGCSVSEEWLTLSNFKSWMEKQDWEGKQLDKDLLFEGNKVYSAETCVFVKKVVNTFALECGATRGKYMLGVSLEKKSGKIFSQCRNPFTKKNERLGYFTCEVEAHQAWLRRKLELAHLLAEEQTDERVAKAIIKRYTNYGE